MPYKKSRKSNPFFAFFSPSKNCDDILTAADKVIEDYIYYKSRLMQKSKNKKSTFFVSTICIATICVLLVYMILN